MKNIFFSLLPTFLYSISCMALVLTISGLFAQVYNAVKYISLTQATSETLTQATSEKLLICC